MFPKIPQVYIVVCKTHGKLGEVYNVVAGMSLFEGHAGMMTEDCDGCEIYPKPKKSEDIPYNNPT